MFGLFDPTCPVDVKSKEWIERRLLWLIEEYGREHLREVEMILPTPEYFPDAYDGSKKAARTLLRRVCRYMNIEPDWIRIRFYVDDRPTLFGEDFQGSAGLYEGSTIWIEESNLQEPMALVGTMAHELGHLHLLGEGRVSDIEEDHEPLTDLFTVFMGLGIFNANSVLRESNWNSGQWSGWSMSKLGYLTMDMFGYAFALVAWYRGEDAPSWARHLRGDVRAPFKKGLKFLQKTRDSLVLPY